MRDKTVGDPDRDPTAVIYAALDAGVTMIDTAHLYRNEALVGRAIGGRRDDVLLATKFGVLWGDDDDWYVRADPAFVRESCEASLRRLGIETIDLYYLHHRSDETPIEETVGAMADLIRAGKIRGLGLSNVTEDDLRRAHAVHPIVAVQERWSLTHREVESMVPAAAELGVAVVAYSPTDHGALHAGDVAPLARALDGVARRLGVTRGQVALSWVHHRSRQWDVRVVPLPGTTSVRHLRANAHAADLALGDDDLAILASSARADERQD